MLDIVRKLLLKHPLNLLNWQVIKLNREWLRLNLQTLIAHSIEQGMSNRIVNADTVVRVKNKCFLEEILSLSWHLLKDIPEIFFWLMAEWF